MAAPSKALRVGIVVDSEVVPQWIAAVVAEIAASQSFCLAHLTLCSQHGRSQLLRRIRTEPRRALYYFYERIDYRLFRSPKDSLAPASISHYFANRVIFGTDDADAHCSSASTSSLQDIQAQRVDVVLDFTASSPESALSASPRYGVWRFRHGRMSPERDAPALFWEMYAGHHISTSVLEDVGAEPPSVIYRSHGPMDAVSLYRSRNPAYWKAATFPTRCLTALRRDASTPLEIPPAEDSDQPVVPIRGVPTNTQMLAFFLRLAVRVTKRRFLNKAFRQEWFVAYRQVDKKRDPFRRTHNFSIIAREKQIMDPFLLDHDGRHYLLVEDYDQRNQKAAISCLELSESGPKGRRQVVLERPYHLSYPYTFTWANEIYMLPETAANNTIELYRAVQFPDEWTLEAVMMRDIIAFDSTLFRHGGKFWLFAAVPVDGAKINDELCIFSSHSLYGEWIPHPLNPVVSDVRRARPAGRIFADGGALIRPAQDCSRMYGYAVVFNKITELTDTDYREIEIGRIDREWTRGNLGTHTFNSDGVFDVIDGRRLQLRGTTAVGRAFATIRARRDPDGNAQAGNPDLV